MAYVVLARKYRPADFRAMVGQEHVVQALANALLQQRLHHAYLFTGTRGVGKTTISRILAKSLNCTGPDGRGGITATPCGTCQACREIDAGRYVDYVELDAASNRGVDEITQLLDQAVYKPVAGRFKVYMIDEVHMLSGHAFNAMLKTLEEPPEYLKFVLATTDPQKVPPTVLSRCLQFNLRPMAPETIQSHLAEVLAAEGLAAEPAALRLLARAARGSMRDALSLTDQAIAFGAGTVDEGGVRQMLGAVDRGHAVRIVEALAASDGAGLVAAVDGLRSLGLSASGLLEELATLLQQMAVVQAVPDALSDDDPETAVVRALAGRLDADEIQLGYSIALHARAELGLAPDEYGGLVMALLRMLTFRPQSGGTAVPGPSAPAPAAPVPGPGRSGPVPARRAAVGVPEATSVTAPVTAPVAAPVTAPAAAPRPAARAERAAPLPRLTVNIPAPAASAVPKPPPWLDDSPPPDDTDGGTGALGRPPSIESSPGESVGSPASIPASGELSTPPRPPAAAYASTGRDARWSELVQQLAATQRISALARELAMQSQCLEFDEAATPLVCRLRVEREMLRAAAPREKLQAALTGAFERQVRLEVEAGPADDTPARRERAAHAARQAEAERIIRDDPLVRSLMEQYKTARIVPGSIRAL